MKTFADKRAEIDAQRATFLHSSHVPEAYEGGAFERMTNKIFDDPDLIKIEASSRFNRISRFTSTILRAAGAIGIVLGSYNLATGIYEVNHAKDALVEDVGEVPAASADNAIAHLLSGTSKDPELDQALFAQYQENVERVINEDVSEAVEHGERAAEGGQELMAGAILGAIGVAGVSRTRRKSKAPYSRLSSTGFDESFFGGMLFFRPSSRLGEDDSSRLLTLRQAPRGLSDPDAAFGHLGRIGAKTMLAVSSFTLAASLASHTSLPASLDKAVTAHLPIQAAQEFERSLVQPALEDYQENAAKEVQQSVEVNLPKTMAIVQRDPNVRKLYKATINQETVFDSSNQPVLNQQATPKLFTELSGFQADGAGYLGREWLSIFEGLMMLGIIAGSKIAPQEFYGAKVRMTQDFFEKHVKSIPK